MMLAIAAFLLYSRTLLPGVDFGDSASIQTTVGDPLLTARDGYPLYFAIGAFVLRLTGGAPAWAMNLTSAIEGAVACGLLVLVAAELAGSTVAAIAGASLFAASYTFWSQCVTAEVYALHIGFVLASLLCLLRWERRPSMGRLGAFFCCYALGFGNHLSMILLLPAFVMFLFATAPRGWRSLLSPGVVALAVLMAAVGAMQYVWNLRTLWFQPNPPDSIWTALQAFWFDVTKSDWRETLVMNVPQSMLRDHLRMYWFDLRQQFGAPGVVVASIGVVALAVRARVRALLLGLLFLTNVVFAFSYNVGDTHVFYLPSHLIVALFAAAGAAWSPLTFARKWPAAAVPLALVAYSCARLYHDYPALDRSRDARADGVLERFTRDLDDQRAMLLVDLNWQIANGLSYVTKSVRPQVPATRLRDVLLHAPALIRDNISVGRNVVLTEQAVRILSESYGPLFHPRADRSGPSLRNVVEHLPPGTRYVLCVLKPTRDFRIDRSDLAAALALLTESNPTIHSSDYAIVAGVTGERPLLVQRDDQPFTRTVEIAGVRTEVRMESWLSADTIRRMGFGHVIANRQHTLIVERGISFAAFDETGTPVTTAYFANIYAELPRFVLGGP